ncbi:hypothetical protein DITRI_Ditri11bG0014100 [Diplodiscus trichospermus]
MGGNGKSIDVWEDRWVDKPPSYKIQLSRVHIADRLIWKQGELSMFSVNSAKKIARVELGKDTIGTMQSDKKWELIWQAKVAPRVKYFCWRMLHNILPCNHNLKLKGVELQEDCSVCGQVIETNQHIFFDCNCSQEIRREVFPGMVNVVAEVTGAVDFWSDLLGKIHVMGDLETYVYAFWEIWNNRNRCLHEGKCSRPLAIALMIKRQVQEFAGAINASNVVSEVQHLVWSPACDHRLRINVDASFMTESKTAQLGAVARNRERQILKLRWERLQREKIRIAHGKESLWDINLIAERFPVCDFLFTTRGVNKFAHNLTKVHCRSGSELVWSHSLPPNFCNPDLGC